MSPCTRLMRSRRFRLIALTTSIGMSAFVTTGVAGAAGLPVPGPALVKGTPCTSTAQACVDMTSKQAWLMRSGSVIRGPIPIQTGGPGKETPLGTFVVQWKDKNHVSQESRLPNGQPSPMPWSVFFADGGIAFHQGTLRTQSAGCVRLSKPDAVLFYDTLQLGDEVQISAGTPSRALDTQPKSGRRPTPSPHS